MSDQVPNDDSSSTPVTPPTGQRREAIEPPPPLSEALTAIMRRVVFRSRQEMSRAATLGRERLERRQAQRDLDHFWMRLGKTAYNLVETGEIDHPGLRKAMGRIDELEARLRAQEAADRASERP